MSANNPRVQVSLKPQEYALLRRLAELQGRSMSALLADLWVSVMPVMERVAVVLEAAKKAQFESTDGLRKAAEKAERDTAPLVQQALNQFDIFLSDAGIQYPASEPVEKSTGANERAGRAPSRRTRPRSTPVPSNHGGQVLKSRRKRGSGQ